MNRSLAPLLLLLAACGPARDDAAQTVLRDSAGISIAETGTPPAAPPRWTASPEPLTSIGTLDGPPEQQLHRVVGALALPGGEIVVANAGTNELRYYDAAGRHLRTVGGEGGGPGEFMTLESIAHGPGGDVLAWDANALRLTRYGPRGELQGSELVPADSFGFFPRLHGVFADGSLLLSGGDDHHFNVSPRPERPPLRLWRYAPADGALDSVASAAGQERFTSGGSGFATRLPVPHGRTTFVAVRGDRVWLADSERPEVRVHDQRGGLRRIVREARAPVPLTTADQERERQRLREGADPRFRAAYEKIAAEMPFPQTYPAFSGLHVDREGRTWLRDAGPGEPRRWTVFDPEGRRLGTAELPEGLAVLEIGADYVLGVWRDDVEVEHVRRHRLHDAAAP